MTALDKETAEELAGSIDHLASSIEDLTYRIDALLGEDVAGDSLLVAIKNLTVAIEDCLPPG